MYKILSCVVTHNRPELTKITIESLAAQSLFEHFIIVYDNGSNEETVRIIQDFYDRGMIDDMILDNENSYPGAATNRAWKQGLESFDADILHRSDNDIFYRPRWDIYTLEVFRKWPEVGQFGLLDLSDYYFYTQIPCIPSERDGFRINFYHHTIGGSYAIRRELWDQGLRHEEIPWGPELEDQEDYLFQKAVEKAGWKTAKAMDPLVCHLGIWWGTGRVIVNHDYYDHTFDVRDGGKGVPLDKALEYHKDSVKKIIPTT